MRTQRIGSILLLLSLSGLSSCGQAVPFSSQGFVGSAVLQGTGGTRIDGSDIGDIYPVTQVVQATAANPYSTLAELPFTGRVPAGASTGAVTLGQPCTDGQTYFYFGYTYPSNNFRLGASHLVLDVKRDATDTEGIFVSGVLSGYPPTAQVDLTSPHLLYPTYFGYGGSVGSWYIGPTGAGATPFVPNTYYGEQAVSHYKVATVNTFDLNIDQLLAYTNFQTVDLVKTGFLPVVIGDDSQVDQAFLVLNGYTISKTALTCTNSSIYTFKNDYVHWDGNSTGQSAFSGVLTPFASWSSAGLSFQSTEFYFDELLPRVTAANITLTQGAIPMSVKRNTSVIPKAAIVINGYGISETGFDRTTGTSAVESWDSGSATTYWNSWVANIAATNTSTAVTLDLIAMLGVAKLKSLLLQGKLNVAIGGSIAFVNAQGVTGSMGVTTGPTAAKRVKGTAVSGPELLLAGTYFTEICQVPDDASSPLSDTTPVPSGTGDHVSPIVSSLSASQISSTGAVIQWLTNEAATSQVGYGVGNTNTLSTNDATLSTFHAVTLKGLQPYRVYSYHVLTSDTAGNQTTSNTLVFQTLR